MKTEDMSKCADILEVNTERNTAGEDTERRPLTVGKTIVGKSGERSTVNMRW